MDLTKLNTEERSEETHQIGVGIFDRPFENNEKGHVAEGTRQKEKAGHKFEEHMEPITEVERIT